MMHTEFLNEHPEWKTAFEAKEHFYRNGMGLASYSYVLRSGSKALFVVCADNTYREMALLEGEAVDQKLRERTEWPRD